MTERARLRGAGGAWSTAIDSVNGLIDDLVRPTTEVARVIVAVAQGDLSAEDGARDRGPAGPGRVPPHRHDRQHDGRSALGFAAEVTRVAREVGTEGKLGGQAEVPGVAGTWKDLTDSVNSMAGNLTAQVRNIAEVTTAVANGDLSPEDHRRRQGRDPRAQEHHQHDGRPADVVRRRGDARRARGRHRGQAGRPGRGARAWPAPGRT